MRYYDHLERRGLESLGRRACAFRRAASVNKDGSRINGRAPLGEGAGARSELRAAPRHGRLCALRRRAFRLVGRPRDRLAKSQAMSTGRSRSILTTPTRTSLAGIRPAELRFSTTRSRRFAGRSSSRPSLPDVADLRELRARRMRGVRTRRSMQIERPCALSPNLPANYLGVLGNALPARRPQRRRDRGLSRLSRAQPGLRARRSRHDPAAGGRPRRGAPRPQQSSRAARPEFTVALMAAHADREDVEQFAG